MACSISSATGHSPLSAGPAGVPGSGWHRTSAAGPTLPEGCRQQENS